MSDRFNLDPKAEERVILGLAHRLEMKQARIAAKSDPDLAAALKAKETLTNAAYRVGLSKKTGDSEARNIFDKAKESVGRFFGFTASAEVTPQSVMASVRDEWSNPVVPVPGPETGSHLQRAKEYLRRKLQGTPLAPKAQAPTTTAPTAEAVSGQITGLLTSGKLEDLEQLGRVIEAVGKTDPSGRVLDQLQDGTPGQKSAAAATVSKIIEAAKAPASLAPKTQTPQLAGLARVFGKLVPRAEFDKMSHADRNVFIRSGGKIAEPVTSNQAATDADKADKMLRCEARSVLQSIGVVPGNLATLEVTPAGLKALSGSASLWRTKLQEAALRERPAVEVGIFETLKGKNGTAGEIYAAHYKSKH